MSAEYAPLDRTLLAPIPELDDWATRAEARAKEQEEARLATRLKCPECGELGLWFFFHAYREGVFIEGPTAYCHQHAGNASSKADDPESLLSMNHYGWLPDGSTWTEGFLNWNRSWGDEP